MSLTLCMQDTSGGNTDIVIEKHHTFQEFLDNSRQSLGYDIDLSMITRNKDVKLTDNVYDFFNELQAEDGEADKVPEEETQGIQETQETEETQETLETQETEGTQGNLETQETEGTQGNLETQETEGTQGTLETQGTQESQEEPSQDEGEGEAEFLEEDYDVEYLEEPSEDEENMEVEMLESDFEEEMIMQKKPTRTYSRNVEKVAVSKPVGDDKISLEEALALVENGANDDGDILASELGELTKELENDEALTNSQVTEKKESDGNALYTNQELLDVLGGDEDVENVLSVNKIYKPERPGPKCSKRRKEEDSSDEAIMKSLFYGGQKNATKKQRINEDIESYIEEVSYYSPEDIAEMLKTVRQPEVALEKLDEEEVEKWKGDVWKGSARRLLPAVYEDVDNEGIYDYEESELEFRDLIGDKLGLFRKKSEQRTSVATAVEGINRLFTKKEAKDRKKTSVYFTSQYIKQELDDDDDDGRYVRKIKREPLSADEDYVPGADEDWTRRRKKSKPLLTCRMCSLSCARLQDAVRHALQHKLPGRAVYPCILCPLGFTTSTELEEHMLDEHKHKRGRGRGSGAVGRPRIKREPVPPPPPRDPNAELFGPACIKKEPQDSEPEMEQDIIMLEEWLEEDSSSKEVGLEALLMAHLPQLEKCAIKLEAEDFLLAELEERERTNRMARYSKPKTSHVHFQLKPNSIKINPNSLIRRPLLQQADEVKIVRLPGTPPKQEVIKVEPVEKQEEEDPDDPEDDSCGEVEWLMDEEELLKDLGFSCETCGGEYEDEDQLQQHHCQERAPVLESARCALCGQIFPSNKRLQYHRSFHQAELLWRGLSCRDCPELSAFVTEKELFDHLNEKHNNSFVCGEQGCNKKFHLRSSLRAHGRIHGKQRHRCEVCNKNFFDLQNLKEHNITHLKVKPFQCHICLKYVNRRSRLRMHLLAHEARPTSNCILACKACGQAFRDAQDAEMHAEESPECCVDIKKEEPMDSAPEQPEEYEEKVDDPEGTHDQAENGVGSQEEEKRGEKKLLEELTPPTRQRTSAMTISMVYRCEYCEKVYCTVESLNNHRQIHRGIKEPFICNICNSAFSTYARCTSHKTTHGFYKLRPETGGDQEQSAQAVSGYEAFPVVKHFLCEICDKTFLHWTYLQVHRRHKHVAGHFFNCKLCGEHFRESWMLNHHRRKYHPEVISRAKISANTSYKCADCEQGFNMRKELAKHRDTEHGDPSLLQAKSKPGPFSCHECQKVYQTKAGLDGHMRIHNGRLYLCALCGNGFAHQAGLATHHKRVHLRQQRHTCGVCGQSFFSSAELDGHSRCHTGEKPFPCDYCPMFFRTKGRRNEHRRIHTGERPYPCDVCGLAFRRSHAMKNHRLIHTGERQHRCPHCSKLFHVRSNLNTHIKNKHPGNFLVLEVAGGAEVRAKLEEELQQLALEQTQIQEITDDPDTVTHNVEEPNYCIQLLLDEDGQFIEQGAQGQGVTLHRVDGNVVQEGHTLQLVEGEVYEGGDQALVDQHGNLVNAEATLVNEQGNLVDADGNLISAEATLVNEQGNLVDADGNLISAEATLVNEQGNLVDADGNLISAEATLVNEQGNLVDADGNLISAEATLVNEQGNLVDADGNLISAEATLVNEQGNLVDADGNLISAEATLVNEQGNLVDADGNLISEEATLVNEQGNLVDADGNLVDEQGNIVEGNRQFVNEHGQLVNEHGNLVDSDGNLINTGVNSVDEQGNLVDEHGNLVNEEGQLVDADGNLVNAGVNSVDEQGNLVDEQGNLVNEEGQLVDADGNLISTVQALVDEHGNLVDEHGNLVNEEGQLVDADGNLISTDQNLVDEQGNLVDEQRQSVDADGNLVNASGNLVNEDECLLETKKEMQETMNSDENLEESDKTQEMPAENDEKTAEVDNQDGKEFTEKVSDEFVEGKETGMGGEFLDEVREPAETVVSLKNDMLPL